MAGTSLVMRMSEQSFADPRGQADVPQGAGQVAVGGDPSRRNLLQEGVEFRGEVRRLESAAGGRLSAD